LNKKRVIMIKRIFNISVLIAWLAIVSSSCSKDADDSSSGNSTNGKTTAEFNPGVSYGTITDQDGNIYKTVTLGNQTWMAENLRTTTYNDGTAIASITMDTGWINLTTGAYCSYNNTINTDTIATYGRLYNWHTVNTGMLAPKGWHVPTNAEWDTLETYFDGGKLKETGITHWYSSSPYVTNESGFTALPGGYRTYHSGSYIKIGYEGCWWSATEGTIIATGTHPASTYAFLRFMDDGTGIVHSDGASKRMGISVRCLKD
jgi:uncharacterized protein (TIGR02145 family)